jgi:hypothetical protein
MNARSIRTAVTLACIAVVGGQSVLAQEWTKDPATWWPDPSTGLMWTGQIHSGASTYPKLAIASRSMYWKLLLSCMMPSMGVVGGCGGGAHTLPCIRSVGGELGLGVLASLACHGFYKALLPQVFVPQRREALVFAVELDMADVAVFVDETGPLLDAYIVVAVVEGVEVRNPGEAKLEAHLRVAHGIAIQFAVVRNGQSGQTAWARLVHGLDDQGHIRRVFDANVEAVIPASSLSENAEYGIHHAASCSSEAAIPCSSSFGSGGSSAERITLPPRVIK